MRQASNRSVSRYSSRTLREHRWYLFFLLLASALLAGCQFPFGASQTSPPTLTPAPRWDPRPTIQVLSSEELYGDDSRAIGLTSPSLASFPAGAVLPPVPIGNSERGVTVLLDADTTISGELYQRGGIRQPGILLLGADASGWKSLPKQLAQNGFVVLVLETDRLTHARQVETMLQSLIAIPGVDAGSIGVIGEGRAADLALLGCAVNSLCDALALLSPQSRATLLNMIPSYGDRPLWLAAAANDSESYGTASALAEAARGEAVLVEATEGRGASLLQIQPDLADHLVQWLLSHLRAQ